MNHCKISVIVAVYKAEKYIHRCLNSILSQTLSDIQVILVDDGSPDKSGAICDDYAQKDNRVLVIHKKNGGVSSARQVGLEAAIGEFVIHVDPDDWIEKDMFEVLYNDAIKNKSDVVLSDFIFDFPNKSEYSKLFSFSYDNGQSLFLPMIDCLFHVSNCNKIVRRSIFVDNDIRFPIGYNHWEDYYISCLIYFYTDKTSYVPKAFYHVDRFSNDNSLSRSKSLDDLHCLKYFISQFEKRFAVSNPEAIQKSKLFVKSRMFYDYGHLLSGEEFAALYPEVNKVYIKEHLGIRPYKLCHLLAGLGLYHIAVLVLKWNKRNKV